MKGNNSGTDCCGKQHITRLPDPPFPPQDGTEGDDLMLAAAMADVDTSVVMVGISDGNFSGSSNGNDDMVIVKLDAASGTETWRYQVWL